MMDDEAWIAKLPLTGRLLLEFPVGEVDPIDGTAKAWAFRNPDGPAAATRIAELLAENGRVKGALVRAEQAFSGIVDQAFSPSPHRKSPGDLAYQARAAVRTILQGQSR